MASYNEPVKNKARRIVIESALSALTNKRQESTLARRSYVREVKNYLIEEGSFWDAQEAARLSDNTISRWESFYDSIVQSKAPESLKVAYLSGPNPENDLRVFCEAGVLPENIWAFESENSIYSDAVVSALDSEFPFIKIINGGLDSFAEASPQRFDIVYLDFCGPLPSRNKSQKTLTALTRILHRHSLNSPGVLITNFSLPTEQQDATGRTLLAMLVACYLYPKEFIERNDPENDFTEGPSAYEQEFSEWHGAVSDDLENYYGQFVTRLLMDHASVISPYNRLLKHESVFGKIFDANHTQSLPLESLFHFSADEGGGGDVIADPGLHSILWMLAALDRKTNNKDPNYPQLVFSNEEFSKFADGFLCQLDVNGQKEKLIDGLTRVSYLLSKGDECHEFLSSRIGRLHKGFRSQEFYQFCDIFMFQQAFEALFRQVAFPYHVNVEKTKRWSYRAKDTPMFMDMFILDECRYLYDWMPTTDMFLEAIGNLERQLVYRFALDGVAKHSRWYNQEYFFGTAVIDQFTERFDAKTLPRRTVITE